MVIMVSLLSKVQVPLFHKERLVSERPLPLLVDNPPLLLIVIVIVPVHSSLFMWTHQKAGLEVSRSVWSFNCPFLVALSHNFAEFKAEEDVALSYSYSSQAHKEELDNTIGHRDNEDNKKCYSFV